jgi:two-component system chemotaxis response regulator CheB
MISVLVVDDSVVVRRLIVDALSDAPGIRVAGTAANGRTALTKVDQLAPDVITMDVEMPEMDGVTCVRELRRRHARIPVIMFSTLTAAGAAATLDALAAGASDYVTKPSNSGSMVASVQAIREQLIPRIHALGGRVSFPYRAPTPTSPRRLAPAVPAPAAPHRTGRFEVLAIGASTGGPDALTRVIGALPADLPVPVLVTQHMPPLFTRMFAERLNKLSAVRVVEAGEHMPVRPGSVYIAPGDRHLEVFRRGTEVVTRLSGAPPENSCRPAVDVMFRSVAQTYGGNSLAVILTGMGQDGRRGAEVLRGGGSEIIAQDETTSVVWGMPGAVVTAGLADTVLPLDSIASHLTSRIMAGQAARSKVVVK